MRPLFALALPLALSTVQVPSAEAIPPFPIVIDGIAVSPFVGPVPFQATLQANGDYTVSTPIGTLFGEWAWNGANQRLRGVGSDNRFYGDRAGTCFTGMIDALGAVSPWEGCVAVP